MSDISATNDREAFLARIKRYFSYLAYLDTTDCSETAYLSDRVTALENQVAELKAEFARSGTFGIEKNDAPNAS